MIDPFIGEFLISPVPLELSFNYCSHKCAYCFANLNVPDRRVDIKAVLRTIQDFQSRKTLTAKLMQQGYPICISNKVDPLAVSNDHQALPVISMLEDLQIPVQIQTKGGRKEDELIRIMQRPAVWYVSISFMDDALRKKIEPGAPTIQSRIELIQKLTEAGHKVILGLNPLVSEWLPDPEDLISACYRAGCRYAWIEHLHFHDNQIENLTQRERGVIGESTIEEAKRKTVTEENRRQLNKAHAICWRYGIETFSGHLHHRSEFHRPYRECYGNTFPTMQDFINACWDILGDEEAVVSYEQFEGEILPRLPDIDGTLCHYLRAGNYGVVEKYTIPNQLNYQGVLRRGWMWPELKFAPSRWRCFAMAMEQGVDEWNPLVDDTGMPWHVWCPGGTEERYLDATELLNVEN